MMIIVFLFGVVCGLFSCALFVAKHKENEVLDYHIYKSIDKKKIKEKLMNGEL